MSDENEFDFESLMGETPQPTIITNDMFRKRVVWDVTPCPVAAEVARKVGLQPASEEVEDMEHEQAHARLSAISPLAVPIQMLSYFAAETLRGAMMVVHGDEVGEAVVLNPEVMGPTLAQVVASIIAELNDIGLLHLPHTVVVGNG